VSKAVQLCELSKKKFFGTYLDNLPCHTGLEYEIVCLQSTDSECHWGDKTETEETYLYRTFRGERGLHLHSCKLLQALCPDDSGEIGLGAISLTFCLHFLMQDKMS